MSAQLPERMRAALPEGLLGRRQARPSTTLRTGPAVPTLVLRGVLVLLVVGAGVTVAGNETQWTVVAALAVVVVLRPHAALLAITVAVLAALLAFSPGPWWALTLLVLLTHALLRLGATADAVSWRGRVELAVLREAAPGFLAVQVVAQAAAALALALDGATPVPWLVAVAVAALAVLAGALVRELRRR